MSYFLRSSTFSAIGALVLVSCFKTESTCDELGVPCGSTGGDAGIPDAASGGNNGTGGAGGAFTGGSGGRSTGGATGGMSGSGAGGSDSGGASACAEVCESPTPVCNASSGSCVECVEKADCAASTKGPACDTGTNSCVKCVEETDCAGSASGSVCDTDAHECVECLGNADCAGNPDGPVCDTDAHACVDCLGNTDCASRPATPVCDIEEKKCVQCLAPADCKDPNASRCEANECKPCSGSGDCAHIPGKNVCGSGKCVQCTAAESSVCGMQDGTPLVCDGVLGACTTRKAGSAGLCDPCVADAECAPGQLCVEDVLTSATPPVTVGYFCHWKKGDTANGAPADCAATGRPYVNLLTNVTSRDGQTADICTLRVSSCPARKDFSNKPCAPTGTPNDSLCGVSPPDDAKCAAFGSTHLCTMTCGSDLDCPIGFPCLTGANPPVCRL